MASTSDNELFSNLETSQRETEVKLKISENISETTQQKSPPRVRRRARLADLVSKIDQESMPTDNVYTANYEKCRREQKEMERKMELGLLTWDDEITPEPKTEPPVAEQPQILEEQPEVTCLDLSNQQNGQESPPTKAHPSKETAKLIRQIEEEKEAILIELDDSLLLSDSDVDEVICEQEQMELEENRVVTVRIVDIKGDIKKYSMLKKDNFSKIIRELAADHKIDEKQVMLTFNEIQIKVYHTPSSIGWRIGDIIDFYKLEDSSDLPLTKADKAHQITLKVQSARFRKRIEITINKVDPLSKLMEEYAKQSGQELSKLTFKFDDDEIEPESTPEELDMDNGDCIDAVEIK